MTLSRVIDIVMTMMMRHFKVHLRFSIFPPVFFPHFHFTVFTTFLCWSFAPAFFFYWFLFCSTLYALLCFFSTFGFGFFFMELISLNINKLMESNQKPFFMIYSVVVRISIRFGVNNFRFVFHFLHILSYKCRFTIIFYFRFMAQYFGSNLFFLFLPLLVFCTQKENQNKKKLMPKKFVRQFYISSLSLDLFPSNVPLSQFVRYLPNGCGTCIFKTHLYCDILFSVTWGIQHINHFSKLYNVSHHWAHLFIRADC